MDDKTIYTYAGVIFNISAKYPYTYLADSEIHAGDIAVVNTSEGEKFTLVICVSHGRKEDAPYSFEKLKKIERVIKKSDGEYAAIYEREFAERQKTDDYWEFFDGDFED